MTTCVRSLKDLRPFLGQLVAISPAIHYSNGKEYSIKSSTELFGSFGDDFYYIGNKPGLLFRKLMSKDDKENPASAFTNRNLAIDPIYVRVVTKGEIDEMASAVFIGKAFFQNTPPTKADRATRLWV